MKVTLITHTPEPEKIVASAAKLYYSSSDIKTLMDGLTTEKVETFIKKLTDLGASESIRALHIYIWYRRHKQSAFASIGKTQNCVLLAEVSEIC